MYPADQIWARVPTDNDWAQCAAIASEHGRSFYLASRMLPADRRRAVLSAYAYCRIADDIVDRADEEGREAAAEALRAWTHELDEPRHPVAVAFAHARRVYHVPTQPILDLLAGVEMDLTISRYADWDALHRYCYHVAGTVGLIVAPIFGCEDNRAMVHASDLGIAMQLTNILRDVREDAEMGRLYLPIDEIRSYGMEPEDILSGRPGPAFREFMAFEVARARSLYESALKGVPALAPSGRMATLAASHLYSRILNEIEAMDYDVFSGRAYVKNGGKLASLSLATACFVRLAPRKRPRPGLHEVGAPAFVLQAPVHPWHQQADRAS
jgi:15-cis-phytoene synthase